MKNKNILVTGGTGFIGFHLLKSVKSMGWAATSVSLNPPIKCRYVEDVRYLNEDMRNVEAA